jgi:hypothetical protein
LHQLPVFEFSNLAWGICIEEFFFMMHSKRKPLLVGLDFKFLIIHGSGGIGSTCKRALVLTDIFTILPARIDLNLRYWGVSKCT